MNTQQTKTAHWQELIEILGNILDERVGLTEACRDVCRLSFELGWTNPLFKPFIGYESETDSFPLEEVRKHWQEDALLKEDINRQRFEERHRPWLLEASQLLLEYAKRHIANR